MNFGLVSAFSKGPESPFSEDPGPGQLYKVYHSKFDSTTEVKHKPIQKYKSSSNLSNN